MIKYKVQTSNDRHIFDNSYEAVNFYIKAKRKDKCVEICKLSLAFGSDNITETLIACNYLEATFTGSGRLSVANCLHDEIYVYETHNNVSYGCGICEGCILRTGITKPNYDFIERYFGEPTHDISDGEPEEYFSD